MKFHNEKNKSSFNNEGAIFMSAQRNPENCKVGIFGIPYDGTTSFRPGARFGPSAIREVSNGLETYSPLLDMDLEELDFVDFGSINITHGAPEPIIEATKNTTKELLEKGLKPLLFGGEHSITTGAIDAIKDIYPEMMMIQLDAHADLRNEWLGSRHNHACTMRRCLEILPNNQLLQIAIRSGTKLEFKEMDLENRLIPYNSIDKFQTLKKRLNKHLDTPIYITLDLDWFDPSIMPGTGTPEPGGYFWNDFEAIINILKNHHIIGADIVELSPQIDPTGVSSIVAAKVARTLIMLLSK